MTKYTIIDLMDRMAFSDLVQAKKELPELLGIKDRAFRRIINLKVGDSGEAKPSQLALIAGYFDVTVDDLIRKDPQPLASFS